MQDETSWFIRSALFAPPLLQANNVHVQISTTQRRHPRHPCWGSDSWYHNNNLGLVSTRSLYEVAVSCYMILLIAAANPHVDTPLISPLEPGGLSSRAVHPTVLQPRAHRTLASPLVAKHSRAPHINPSSLTAHSRMASLGTETQLQRPVCLVSPLSVDRIKA